MNTFYLIGFHFSSTEKVRGDHKASNPIEEITIN